MSGTKWSEQAKKAAKAPLPPKGVTLKTISYISANKLKTMPLPILAAAIPAAAGLGQSILTGITNKNSREWQEQQYDKQRADSLADWNMMNEYNSPAAQMARYKEAGLNENLIYGQPTTSPMARGATTGSYKPETPDVVTPTNQAVGTYYDVQIKEQQLDNMKAQQAVMMADQMLKTATTAYTVSRNARSQFDLELADSLKGEIQAMTTAKSEMAGYSRDILQNTAATKIETAKANLAQALENVVKTKSDTTRNTAETSRIWQSIENLKKDGTLKQLDIDLKKLGVQPGDQLWQRVIARLLSSIGFSF